MKNKRITTAGQTTEYCHNCGRVIAQHGGGRHRFLPTDPCPKCKEPVHKHCAKDGCKNCKDEKK